MGENHCPLLSEFLFILLTGVIENRVRHCGTMGTGHAVNRMKPFTLEEYFFGAGAET